MTDKTNGNVKITVGLIGVLTLIILCLNSLLPVATKYGELSNRVQVLEKTLDDQKKLAEGEKNMYFIKVGELQEQQKRIDALLTALESEKRRR